MDEKAKKEMLCRMVIRCNKVKKHSPKKVKTPILKVEKQEAIDFLKEELKQKKWYSRSETAVVRCALEKWIPT